MSLPDSAEYWWGVKGKLKQQKPVSEETREADRQRTRNHKASFPEHECHPNAVPGVPHRWKCPVCGNRISRKRFKNKEPDNAK